MEIRLNIDISLIKRYSATKRRKELFAFAMWCHVQHVSAVVFNVTSTMLRKRLSIGKAKADRLMADAAEDMLFTIEGTTFRAGSFRDKTVKFTRKHRKYSAALVKTVTFDSEHDYTLKELYDLINEILAIFPITAKEDRDCLTQRGGRNNGRCVQNQGDATSRTLTLKKFSQNLKMSVSSCSRILRRLADQGKIKRKPSVCISAIASEFKQQIVKYLRRVGLSSVTFEHNGLSYVIVPCAYSIPSRDMSESYKHKIYNYHKAGQNAFCKLSTIPQLCGF